MPRIEARGLLAAIAMLIVPSLLLTACAGNVTQDELNKVKATRAVLESEYGTLQERQSGLKEDYATLKERQTALEGEYAESQTEQAALKEAYTNLQAQKPAIGKTNAAVDGVRDVGAGVQGLRNAAEIKFALASGAIQRFRHLDWDPSVSPGLASTAIDRLGEFSHR